MEELHNAEYSLCPQALNSYFKKGGLILNIGIACCVGRLLSDLKTPITALTKQNNGGAFIRRQQGSCLQQKHVITVTVMLTPKLHSFQNIRKPLPLMVVTNNHCPQ